MPISTKFFFGDVVTLPVSESGRIGVPSPPLILKHHSNFEDSSGCANPNFDIFQWKH
jgi:hypothetical protein